MSGGVQPADWMLFVDGENFTIRAQEFASAQGRLPLREGELFKPDCFLWFPGQEARHSRIVQQTPLVRTLAVRAFYYTSVQGDDQAIQMVTEHLWKMGFSGYVFKKTRKEQKAKGVDIALTKDMLSHAFLGNYGVAVLVAGDGDYVPLVEEVKRLGKQVFVAFFKDNGLSPELRLASDRFFDLTEVFVRNWTLGTPY